jgi:protein MAK11
MLKIVAGSYERILYGLDVTPTSTTMEITPSFIYPSHLSCIKTLASSGPYLASGSTDEHIKLYSTVTNRELGTLLLQHSGTITHLEFYKQQVLVSASEDGTIGVYRCSDWERLKSLSGHKGAVNWVAIHPSGKLCLSVGKTDCALKCWDLVRGLCARSSRLERGAANRVLWSGETGYAVIFDNAVEIVDLDMGKTVAKCEVASRINTAVSGLIGESRIVVVGCEDGEVFNIRTLIFRLSVIMEETENKCLNTRQDITDV